MGIYDTTEAAQGQGRFLYDVLRARLARLRTSDQITLGFAIQKASPWPSLSEEQRRAFDEAAEDLGL
jgi:hypothetical protein